MLYASNMTARSISVVIPAQAGSQSVKHSLYKEGLIDWILVPAFAGINMRRNDVLE